FDRLRMRGVESSPSALVLVSVTIFGLMAFGFELLGVERFFILLARPAAQLRLCFGSAKFFAIDGGLVFVRPVLFCLAKFVKVDEVAHDVLPPNKPHAGM